jgi:hypothetical protein
MLDWSLRFCSMMDILAGRELITESIINDDGNLCILFAGPMNVMVLSGLMERSLPAIPIVAVLISWKLFTRLSGRDFKSESCTIILNPHSIERVGSNKY